MQPTTTLNILCALNCEAKAAIDFFKLRKQSDSPFALYTGVTNDGVEYPLQINVVISGIGAMNMATAVGWLAAKTTQQHSVWLNVGTAGHAQLALGQGFIVSSSRDVFSERAYYPPLIVPRPVGVSACMSLNAPGTDYPEEGGLDMEVAAFYQSAIKFAPPECVQSYKVVSDTPETGIEHLNAKVIQELIQPHAENIVAYAFALIKLSASQPVLEHAIEMPEVRATHSQIQIFKDYAQKLTALLNWTDIQKLNVELQSETDIKIVLKRLKQQLDGFQPIIGGGA